MNLAIIPARSGSKRIKNKNIVKVNNKPIIHYALDAAKKSKIFHKIHVSTDSKKIENIVNNLGYEIDFLRPKHLADDFTGIIPVLKHVLEIYKKDFGLNFKNIDYNYNYILSNIENIFDFKNVLETNNDEKKLIIQ